MVRLLGRNSNFTFDGSIGEIDQNSVEAGR